jgi:hypothetical protein
MANHSHYSTSFKRKDIQKSGSVQRMYECCQSETCSSNRKKLRTEDGRKTRDARRMNRFACI